MCVQYTVELHVTEVHQSHEKLSSTKAQPGKRKRRWRVLLCVNEKPPVRDCWKVGNIGSTAMKLNIQSQQLGGCWWYCKPVKLGYEKLHAISHVTSGLSWEQSDYKLNMAVRLFLMLSGLPVGSRWITGRAWPKGSGRWGSLSAITARRWWFKSSVCCGCFGYIWEWRGSPKVLSECEMFLPVNPWV